MNLNPLHALMEQIGPGVQKTAFILQEDTPAVPEVKILSSLFATPRSQRHISLESLLTTGACREAEVPN